MPSPRHVHIRSVLVLAGALALVGCPLEAESSDTCSAQSFYADADGDGYGSVIYPLEACESPIGYVDNADDCNDVAADISPSIAEICDGVDNDCDGTVDQTATDAPLWYLDQDGDSVGADTATVSACAAPSGYVATGGDCDDLDSASLSGTTWFVDSDADGFGGEATIACDQPAGTVANGGDCADAEPSVHPDADESCNEVDDDCDASIDEDAVDVSSFFADQDGDAFGDAGASVQSCGAPDGYVANATDCDDTNPAVSPDAVETCSEIDDDCDGLVDEADPDATGVPIWYPDADADLYGAADVWLADCTQPTGYVAAGNDCDDADAGVFPGAAESCDGRDQDCDGSIDESALDAQIWYVDLDGDAFGDPAVTVLNCELPAGYADNGDDCNDFAGDVFPGAPETCDGEDDDCDGQLDNDPVDPFLWYADRDGDGFGNINEVESACSASSGFVADPTDCNDISAVQNPAAVETCSGLDEDCDGLVDGDDPDMNGLAVWYLDEDSDNHGVATTFVSACTQPEGYAIDGDDCDDLDAYAFPGGDETCDGTDEDCDGTVDESALDASTWYVDGDMDGFGDGAIALVQCDSPSSYVARDGDCDDTDEGVSPEGFETCDGFDQDCDGSIDENAWYADADGDGFGDPSDFDDSCVAPAGFVADASDCDDTLAEVSPAGVETCGGADEDCDGLVDDADADTIEKLSWYADTDADGWGEGPAVLACVAPSATSGVSGDCDDSSAQVSPNGVEICGGGDEDCDGLIDDLDGDATALLTWFGDGDGDGYGVGTATISACALPNGYSATSDDCDDGVATISPGAYETCGDGIDQDCDGVDTTVCDADADGYDVSVDCDETNAAINPGAREICDAANADEDCDGVADNDDSSASTAGKTRFYLDADFDSFGDPGGTLKCDLPTGYVTNADDCDDGDAAISPVAQDVCDSGVDEDCSGEVDDCYRYLIENAATTFTGASTNTAIWAAAAGDFDGSGVRQIVMGSPVQGNAYAPGAVSVFDWAGETELSLDSAAVTITGSGSLQRLAERLFVGDSDGDGSDDLFVQPNSYSGVFIYGGDLAASANVWDVQAAYGFDYADCVPGDVNGDGLMDIVGGTRVDDNYTYYPIAIALGPVFGYYTDLAHYNIVIEGFDYGSPPERVAGDFDGDGLDDLAAQYGAYGTGPWSIGIFNDVVHATDVSDADFALSLGTTGVAKGGLGAGDVDSDGLDDLVVVRSIYENVHLVTQLTASGDIEPSSSAELTRPACYVSSGSAVVANLDDDANGEVAITVNRCNDEGHVWVLDEWAGTVDADELTFPGVGATLSTDAAYWSGDSLSNAGDMDGDGTDDLLITASLSAGDAYAYTPPAWLWLGSEIFR